MRMEGKRRFVIFCRAERSLPPRNARPYRGLNKRRWVYQDPLGLSPGRLTEARFASTAAGLLVAVRGKDRARGYFRCEEDGSFALQPLPRQL